MFWEGKPPKIPVDATLRFEIELINWFPPAKKIADMSPYEKRDHGLRQRTDDGIVKPPTPPPRNEGDSESEEEDEEEEEAVMEEEGAAKEEKKDGAGAAAVKEDKRMRESQTVLQRDVVDAGANRPGAGAGARA